MAEVVYKMSDVHSAALLHQDIQSAPVLSNADDKPVVCASRSINKFGNNYCTIEKELLGIVRAVKLLGHIYMEEHLLFLQANYR